MSPDWWYCYLIALSPLAWLVDSRREAKFNCTLTANYYDCLFRDVVIRSELEADSIFFGVQNFNDTSIAFRDSSMVVLPKKIFETFPAIQYLSSDACHIQKLLGGTFANAQRLQELHLYDNRISRLNNFVFNGALQLEILSLYNNTIKLVEEHAFDGLGHLRLLYMDENQLEKLPEGVFSGLEELQILELQHNRIREIGEDQFVLCVMLRELNLSANQISTFNMTQLQSLNKLETLDIARNYLDEVFVTKYVRTLNAQENQISRIVIDQGDFFQLTHLNLSRNNIANINNIFKFRNLIELDVSYNELVTLDFVIFAFMKNLKDIKLNNNRLWILDNGIPSPAKSLRSLNLAHNKFLYLDLAVLDTFPALEYIYLHGNDLIDMQIEEIEQHFPYLTLVSCDNNDWDCINLMHIVTLLERAYVKWSNGNRNCTRPEQHRLICCTSAEHHLREKIVRLTREIYKSRKMIKQLIMENAELRSEVEMQYLPGDGS
ncbi:leucine-rich repeat transmembrane neuronal protein 2 [Anopheles darlingi]|uniref:Leucine-rich repeat transmembrane neuronal protein 2 n=1 Tax=Anopheles darlingi TaxID=43151 RepID=W5J5K4_ANODA|nr:protein artichoke-like [Anopheles darlingi]ETN59737.1 leucine-rich repeat transmembrane neuronal protein 2 [Anopheles darlingi]